MRPVFAGIFWFIIIFIISRLACDTTPKDAVNDGLIGAAIAFILVIVLMILINALQYKARSKNLKKLLKED